MAVLEESTGLEQFSLAGLRLPVTLRLEERMGDDELIAYSRRIRPYQVERNAIGELEIVPPLGLAGGHREAVVIAKLSQWAEDFGGIGLGPNAGFTLPDSSVRAPDAGWISQAQFDEMTQEQKEGFIPRPPEFLIELLPQDRFRKRLEARMEMWIANGAKLAWMIDPFAATLSIYRPSAAVEVLARPEWVEADSVVAGFRLETSRLWAK